MFSKKQVEFMKSIGIDIDYENISDNDMEKIEDVISQTLQESGFDKDYNITEIGKMCESILDNLS